jgi:ABC-2 type transport system ATP-binding protein
MVDVTMTPPRDGGPPGNEELLARVIPLRRRGEAGDSELLTAPPPATAPGPRDEPGEPTSAVADRERKPAVTGGLRSPHEVAAPDAGQTLSGRRVSRTRLGIAALVAVLVAAGAFAVASSDPHVVARAAHTGDSKSAPAAAKASAAKGVAARAAAARTALRAARKRAAATAATAATAARERASRVARAHALAVSRARAARAKQRAQSLAREQASEAPPAPTVVPAAPVAMQPVVANSPAVVTHPRSSAPRRSASSAGGCATAVPGQLGC